MIVTPAAMKQIEEAAFAAGATPEGLMENAGQQIAGAVRQFFPAPGRAFVFYGKGHNGGDALVTARHLAAFGWEIIPRPAFAADELSPLTRAKLDELGDVADSFHPRRPAIILDGLLGIGASGALRGPIRDSALEINRIRREQNAHTFAIDIPTGLDGDTGAADEACVVADFTLTVGLAKTGLLADAATNFTGRLAVLPLPELTAPAGDTALITPPALAGLLPRRLFDTHKGDYGRLGIVAGSPGLTGAALMASLAAVRAGAGLVTLFVSEHIWPVVAAAAAPEVMVQPVANFRDVLKHNLDALAIGPGLGRQFDAEVRDVIVQFRGPAVVDADAINALHDRPALIARCAGPRLLTPHPGELERIFPRLGRDRETVAREFVARFPVTLLHKGARTIVAEQGRPCAFNTTGHPGMAAGGMGDILTGACGALLAQGLKTYDAARLGAWLCGRAAEIAVFQGHQSAQSLTATDLPTQFGPAFRALADGCW
jgi:NAD(P)H-hydrate epimerase